MTIHAELALLSEAVYLPTWPEVEAAIGPDWQLVVPMDIGDVEGMLCRRGAEASALVFRGTEFTRGVLEDVGANFGPLDAWEGPGAIHRGYARYVGTIYEAALQAASEAAGAPLYITGHSLGGAMATLFSARADYTGRLSGFQTVSFGAPRCFNREAAKAMQELPVTRYCIQGDPAPLWPLNPWMAHSEPAVTLPMASLGLHDGLGLLSTHSIEAYRLALEELAEAA
jgi:hypothetical protein